MTTRHQDTVFEDEDPASCMTGSENIDGPAAVKLNAAPAGDVTAKTLDLSASREIVISDAAFETKSAVVTVRTATNRESPEGELEENLLREVELLHDSEQRELLRLLQNARSAHIHRPSMTLHRYLQSLGTEQNRTYDIFEHNLRAVKSFDLILFRGNDPIGEWITKLMQTHRHVDFFSHCGMALKTPLVPFDGHYLRGGSLSTERRVKVLPFIQIRLETDDVGAQTSADLDQAHTFHLTVLACRGLPKSTDEGGTEEDPYVRVALQPYNMLGQTKTIWNAGTNPTFAAHHGNKMAFSCPAGPHPSELHFDIEVWDEDVISPDDLLAAQPLPLTPGLLKLASRPDGVTKWVRLRLADDVADEKTYNRVHAPVNGVGGPIVSHGSQNESGEVVGELAVEGRDLALDGILKGNLLVAPMGLRYQNLYAEEKGYSLSVQEKVLKSMFSWTYFTFTIAWVAVIIAA
jgi:hypothetical protein